MDMDTKHNDSLVDMEKYMQDVMPAVSPRRSKPSSAFMRGPSSIELMKLEKSNQTKKAKRRHISNWGIAFLVVALLQAVVIAGLQIAIAVLGDFNGGRLEEYLPCVLEEYNATNRTLPANSTFPSFGKDKEIYVYIFIFLVVYNFGLCLYALVSQRIVEVWSFVAINFLLVVYASVQVYQFRGFGDFCDPITLVGWIALGNVIAVLLFNVIFCFMAVQIYVEFGWKLYKFVNCNPALRFYYRNYEIFLSLVKVLIVFTIAFLVGQAALILPLNDYEFWVTYPFIFGMITLYFYAFFMVRRESHIAFMTLLVIGLLLISYYGFKVYRYVTRSCPVCLELNEELNERREDFQHLIMMASLNMLVTLLFVFSLIRVWSQFGKGLADHFYIHGFWFDKLLKKKPAEDAYINSVGTGKMVKQKSAAMLVQVKPLPINSNTGAVARNSSLDEHDYTDYVFTPSSEDKPQLQLTFLPSSPAKKDLNPTDINRTFSLPPILEKSNH